MKSLVFLHFKFFWSTFFVDFIHRKHLTGRVLTSDWIPLQISDSVAEQFEYCPLSTETYPTRRRQGRTGGHSTVLRINVLNTAHFCILCVLNILCHISCWGSTWKFHVLMLDCGRIWHLWQDVAGATCPASTCCCLQSDRKPGLNYVTEWPTLVFLWN